MAQVVVAMAVRPQEPVSPTPMMWQLTGGQPLHRRLQQPSHPQGDAQRASSRPSRAPAPQVLLVMVAPPKAPVFTTQRCGVDRAGNLFIADSYNNRIRKVTQGDALPAASTVAGNPLF
jgi:hypothetical protein